MDKKIDIEGKQEYTRLNEEMMMRINNIYKDGATLTSFFLIYFATLIAGLLVFCNNFNFSFQFLIFVLISFVGFFFPVLLVYSFSIKYKENFLGICNISAFIETYYQTHYSEKTNDLGWENLHKDTITPNFRESREYFLLGLISYLFLVASSIIFCYVYFTKESKISPILFWIILVGVCIALFYGFVMLVKIFCATDMRCLAEVVEQEKLFYKIETKFLSNCEPESYKEKLEKLKEAENNFNLFLLYKGIPEYKATQIFKIYFSNFGLEIKEKGCDSRLTKKIELLAKKERATVFEYINKVVNQIRKNKNVDFE